MVEEGSDYKFVTISDIKFCPTCANNYIEIDYPKAYCSFCKVNFYITVRAINCPQMLKN